MIYCQIHEIFLSKLTKEDLSSLMFGDYMNPDALPEEKVYSEVHDVETMHKILEDSIKSYNANNKKRMDLVIFRFQFSAQH